MVAYPLVSPLPQITSREIKMTLVIQYLSTLSLENDKKWQNFWLESPDATLFNSPTWFKACSQAFPKREQLIVMAKAEDCLGAVLLLEKRGNQWTLMGRPYMDRAAILFTPSFIRQYGHELLSVLLKRLIILELSELSANQLDTLLASTKYLFKFFCQASVSPRFLIAQPSLTSKEKKEIRRLSRKLSELGTWSIEFELINNYSFELMSSIEKLSHKTSRKQAILEKEEVKTLFICAGAVSDSCVAFLKHNNEPIAHLLGFIENDSFLAYHMAYNENWANYAPGKLLVYHILPKLEEAGLLYFDFSRGQSSFKEKFSTTSNVQYCLKIFDRSCVGYLNYLMWGLEQSLYLARLKFSSCLPRQWKDEFRPHFNFWLNRRK
jgi:CelD/BcsL family acetyltransferase involved in cellulose biosynthesis